MTLQVTPKPTAPPIPTPESIPALLRASDRWVCWKYELRESKWTKVPVNAQTLRFGKSNDSKTWTTFDIALISAQKHTQIVDGIGIVLGAGLWGIDLDNAVDSVTGEITSYEAKQIVTLFNTYTEYSPSGKGLHLYGLGKLPPAGRVTDLNGQKIEAFDDRKFFTVTGRTVPGMPFTVEDRQHEVTAWHVKIFGTHRTAPEKTTPVDAPDPAEVAGQQKRDDALIAKILRSKQGEKFRRLFVDGDMTDYIAGEDGRVDHSRADYALLGLLACRTQDPQQLDRLFRRSALCSPERLEKWNRLSFTTIDKILSHSTAANVTFEQLQDVAGCPPLFRKSAETDPAMPSSLDKPHRSDIGNAERLIARCRGNICYVPAHKAWLLWNQSEGRWLFDDLDYIKTLAVALAKSMLREAVDIEDSMERGAAFKHASASQNNKRLEAMIKVAGALAAIRPSELDRDRYLLNCLNGTLDLRTGTLRPHRQDDMLTKMCPVQYIPDAHLDEWDSFLNTALRGDKELISFVQRVVGYTLTGDTREEKLFFVHGEGGTGKSTFIEAVKMVLGDYSRTADFKTFLEKSFANGGAARGDVARLCGCRLVSAIETNANKNLDIGLVKALTGRDTVTARFLYKGEFEFQPEFKLWLIANDAPVVPDDDDAAWRRLVRIPFENVIPAQQRDTGLKAMLTDPAVAGPAILAWAVRGCLEWQRDGLRVPSAIERAIHEYRGSMDPLKDFFAEKCAFADDASVGSSELYRAYLAWAERTGKRREHVLAQNAFVMRLTKRGCKRTEAHGKRMLLGVGLLTDQEEMF